MRSEEAVVADSLYEIKREILFEAEDRVLLQSLA